MTGSLKSRRVCSALLSVVFALCVGNREVAAETRVIDIAASYGVSRQGIAHAIADAANDFSVHPDDTVVLQFGPGSYDLSHDTGKHGVIDVSNIKPGEHGRLVFRGAGSEKTTLVMNKDADWIYGRNVYRVSFVGLHMTADRYTVSQGHVTDTAPGFVVLSIDDGYPSPADIFNPHKSDGRYLRRYTDSSDDPHLIEADNEQIPWVSAEPVSGSLWRINLKSGHSAGHYQKGDFVCIKSKPDGNSYWFFGGSDISFEDVKWTQKSRGTFRGGIGKVHISHCRVERAPPIKGRTPCLSTPGGGPQIGQPHDPPSMDDVVEDSRFTATGDDSIAFFNASGAIRNNVIADSFARGILLRASPSVETENNRVLRCPVLRKAGE